MMKIFRLKNHSNFFLIQMKNLKNKKQGYQKLKQANQNFQGKLLEKDEEIYHLKSNSQKLDCTNHEVKK